MTEVAVYQATPREQTMTFNHHIHAALARERRNTLLAEAAAARQARQARAAGCRRASPRAAGPCCATGHTC